MQVTQLLQDKWDCSASYVVLWEVLLSAISLFLLAATTVLTTLSGGDLSGEQPALLAEGIAAVLLPCDSVGSRRANALAGWDVWSSRLESASSEADFGCFVAFLTICAIQTGEQLYITLLSR